MTQIPSLAIDDDLIAELLSVHDKIGRRNNASYVSMVQSRSLGKDLFSSLASALLTLGGLHAPILQTYHFLSSFRTNEEIQSHVESELTAMRKIPGWGSSFEKGQPDPEFKILDEMLSGSPIHCRMHYVSGLLHGSGIQIYPNASCYTCAVCISKDLPVAIAQYFLVNGRLNAWTSAYLSGAS
jgi:citrate synthase